MMKRLLLFMLVCLALMGVQGTQVMAYGNQLTNDVSDSYNFMLSANPVSITGISDSTQMYFQIPSYWKVQDVKIHLDYKVTSLLKQDISSVTVQMNNSFVHSFRPEYSEQDKKRLTVSLPMELIREGGNSLTISADIQTVSNDSGCSEDDSYADWLQLFNTSNVEVVYSKMPLSGSIQQFYEYFLGLDLVSANLNEVVVPENSQSAVMEAASYAIAGLSQANSLANKIIPLGTLDSNTSKSREAIVVIGLYHQLPERLTSLLGKHDFEHTAVMQVVNKDKQPTLVITSQNEELLVKAGRLVGNQEMMMQLDHSLKVIDSTTDVDTREITLNQKIYLTETGDMLKGWNHQEKSYFISLPANRMIADGSKISIDFRYAKNLNFDQSMLTVLINDKPIGSKKLSAEMADIDNLTIPIPKNLKVSGDFSVTLAFDLRLDNDTCQRNADEMPWAYIVEGSAIQINTSDDIELLFTNYPYPFSRDGQFNKIGVVLPTERDAYTYQAVSNVFNLLGHYVGGNIGEIRYFEDTAKAKELEEYNLIAIGSYDTNKVIRDQNLNLYFRYDEKGESFLSNEKMSIDTEYGKRIGTLQLIASPYKAEQGMLVISGVTSDNTYLASTLLSTESGLWSLYGDGVTIDKDRVIHPYRFKKEAIQESASIIDTLKQRSDMVSYLSVAVLILLLILVSLFLLIHKYRGKRRGTR